MAPASLQMTTVQQQLAGKPLWRTPGSMVGQGAVRGHASPLLLPATQRPTCPGATPRRINLPFASFSLSNALHLGVKHKAYAHDMKDLCGTWVKDKDASESMKAAMDMMQLGGIVRQAVKLVRGIKIEQDEKTWTMAVFSVLAWFKVTERYSLDGAPSYCKRRDLRRGKHTGQLYPDAPGPHGGLVLGLKWDAPHGGEGTDEFVLRPRGTAAAEKLTAIPAVASPAAASATPSSVVAPASEQELHVYSNMVVDGKPCGYRTVYHRAHHK